MIVHRRRGFTLLELMVVLALLAITAAAAVPALLSARSLTPTQRAVADVRALMMAARDAARESGREATLVFAPAEGRYWLTRGDSTLTAVILLGAGVRLAGSAPRTVCRFIATGPAAACRIVVQGEATDTVFVDPWSGDVAESGR